jgi:hypothetical protein
MDPAAAALVAPRFTWYIQDGHRLLGLVKHLAETGALSPTGKPHWGVASVRGLLTNPPYPGTIYGGRMRYRPPPIRRSARPPLGRPRQTGMPRAPMPGVPPATVPAILPAERFQLTQAKLATNQSFARRHHKAEPYLLRALISCGPCGLSCMARKVQPHNTYDICTGKCWPVRQRTGAHCSSRFMPARQLDALVWHDLCELLRHPQIIAQALERAHAGPWLPRALQARRANLRRGQGSGQQQLERLTAAYLKGAAHSSVVWDRSSPSPSCAAAAPRVWNSPRSPAGATRQASGARHHTGYRCLARPVTASNGDFLPSPPACGKSRWLVAAPRDRTAARYSSADARAQATPAWPQVVRPAVFFTQSSSTLNCPIC